MLSPKLSMVKTPNLILIGYHILFPTAVVTSGSQTVFVLQIQSPTFKMNAWRDDRIVGEKKRPRVTYYKNKTTTKTTRKKTKEKQKETNNNKNVPDTVHDELW